MRWKRLAFAADNASNVGHPNQSRCLCDHALEPRISCPGARPGRKKRWKNCVAFTGDLCTLSLVEKVPTQKKREI